LGGRGDNLAIIGDACSAFQTLAIDRIALARNLDLLAQIGLLERQGGMGGRGLYRITAQGVLECERKGLKPEPSLVRKE
jgi:hypothetical protein